METQGMASGQHSAAPSALGYQYQTSYCLFELLRRINDHDRSDAAISLELHDDVAWDENGTATELLQLKHHLNRAGSLGDQSSDLWKTIEVWLDAGDPADPQGPMLTLITTSTATPGSAAHALRADSWNPAAALDMLRTAAAASTAQATAATRARFLDLSPADQQAFVSRMVVVDAEPTIDDLDHRVRQLLWAALPPGQEDTFLALVWRWWASVALDMLRQRRRSMDVGEVRAAIGNIRNQFHDEDLPTLIELADIDEAEVVEVHGERVFVQQMRWVQTGQVHLKKAIVDYYRAVTQSTEWLDRDLVDLAELRRFEDNLRDEWDRAFADMLEDLGAEADPTDDATKARLGRALLRKLRESTAVTVRRRYSDPFFARGKRHELADTGHIGWHPDFQQRLEALLGLPA
jgi:hypothetical protein